ncbi:MAG: SDR family NAD(P)-dependent oxidoreductase [Steroidobacteraceae bacterium]
MNALDGHANGNGYGHEIGTFDVRGRVVIVTGAGSGGGAAIARVYARGGARVVVSDVDYALAGTVAGDIRRLGGQALAQRCDVSREEEVRTLISRAQREFHGLDFLVNNAGPCLADDPLEHWQRMIAVNLMGTMYSTRQAIDAMKERGGAIVNVAANSGLGFGPEQQPAYGAAKAGVMRFTAALAWLQASHGIRVNCIVPDVIQTPDEFASAVLAISCTDLAGRIVLCSTGRPLEVIDYSDPGYRQSAPF